MAGEMILWLGHDALLAWLHITAAHCAEGIVAESVYMSVIITHGKQSQPQVKDAVIPVRIFRIMETLK